MSEFDLRDIIDQIDHTYRERRTPGAPYTSDRRMLEFMEYHWPSICAAARKGLDGEAAVSEARERVERE